jgi:hypothetical protein
VRVGNTGPILWVAESRQSMGSTRVRVPIKDKGDLEEPDGLGRKWPKVVWPEEYRRRETQGESGILRPKKPWQPPDGLFLAGYGHQP